MQDGNRQDEKASSRGRKTRPPSFYERVGNAAARAWRPAGSVLAAVLALFLTWHVVSGRHGISVWQQKRVEDKQLRKEIDSLQQENARLKERVEKLKSDPHA